MFLNL